MIINWALISISLFNALLLIWLGLTVVLNAEHRDWGVRLTAIGFLSGAVFFVCHTVIAGHELTLFRRDDLNNWWRIGWYPVVLAPFSWYTVILWYAGFWDGPTAQLRRLHRPMLGLLTGYILLLTTLLTFTRSVPLYTHLTELDFSDTTTIAGFPILLLLYPPFGLICIGMAWDALRHPAPSQRMMGDLARQRARPWLVGATLALLLVITIVAIFIVGITQIDFKPNVDIIRFVVYLDLLLETLIGAAIILLGQAIVSYEIFTGHVLPRRGFFRQWRGTVLFAWGTAWVVGFALNWNIQSIFSFVFITVVMMILYAFFGWRTFKHREELIAQLHPFMANHPTSGLPGIVYLDQQALTLFTAICREVLDTTQAYLIPLGARVPLVGPPLAYPPSATPPTLRIVPELFPDTLIVALDAASYAGATWGIPLWAGQGLIGALLLGPKRNNAVYTREEIEIARMSAERILDTLAGEQIAQRLVQIERRRLAETKVLDLRTRRALHDEILPELHMIALRLSPNARTDPAVSQAIQSLTQIHHQISDLIHTSTGIFSSGSSSVSFVQALQDGINEEYADAFDSMTWQFPQESFELDPLLREVVMNAIREVVRNAALHGRGSQPERKLHLTLQIRCEATRLIIEVQDDGVGMTFGPRRVDGGGSGLMLHSTLLAISGGELSIESPASDGTHIVISAPIQCSHEAYSA